MGLIAWVKGHTFVLEANPLDVRIITTFVFLVDNEVLNFGIIKYRFVLLGSFLHNTAHICIFITFCISYSRVLFLLNIYLLLWRHRTLSFTACLLSFVWRLLDADIKKRCGRRGFCTLLLFCCLCMLSLCRDLNICQNGPLGCRRLGNQGWLCLSCRLFFTLLSLH